MAEEWRDWWEFEMPPYGVIVVGVVGAMVVMPMVLGEPNAVAESIQEIISPTGMMLLPLTLLLLIRFLSTKRPTFFSDILTATGDPASIHRVGGSPVGVALILIILLFLVYYRSSLNGEGEEEENGD
ncbi:hypothetical protein EJ110_NYTH04491 [Nymphaea thermarum]|uniref:uncharacterized protein LOC116263007 n=1 Tax=Nymphaea colorata TaxID=210225 RepID=UPI00129E22A3|nr:uncharacterized protein LOC116263007 [Nymphaea colorata]KAF3795773.1 hypothetical protein EJ110_NYTH04491 [Nymphaea thermarum]